MEDVRADALTPSATRTYCPYKGAAAYFNVSDADTHVSDGAWTLSEPYGEATVVRNYVSFWGDKTEVYADGISVARRIRAGRKG